MGGYDCVLLPGAMTKSSAIKYPAMCGGVGGLVTATSTIAKTLCSKCSLTIKFSVANSYFQFFVFQQNPNHLGLSSFLIHLSLVKQMLNLLPRAFH